MKLRIVKSDDFETLLQLTNSSVVFNRIISEADLAITKFFPNGFWVAEEEGKVVGYACGHFRDVPVDVLER